MCLGEVTAVNSLEDGSYTLHGISLFFFQIKVMKTGNSVGTQVTVNTTCVK
jgi:hypothetical protein